MSVTIRLHPRQRGSVAPVCPLGAHTLDPPAEWARVTGPGTMPAGGYLVRASSDREAFRIAISAADGDPPRHGGFVVNGDGPVFRAEADADAQIWLRAA